MHVIFSHGKEGSPNGTKAKIIEDLTALHGHSYTSLDYGNCKNAGERVELLKSFLTMVKDKVALVGSSMGGYVSAAVSNEIKTEGLFLIAPALYMSEDEYEVRSFHSLANNIWVRHGWDDDIISPEKSIKFCKQHKCRIVLEKDNHRMSETKANLARDFEQFLNLCMINN